jgi:hypothetical protein
MILRNKIAVLVFGIIGFKVFKKIALISEYLRYILLPKNQRI